jgi:transposase
LKRIAADAETLLALLERWRAGAGKPVKRNALAYEAGRDGFWLARLAKSRGIEVHVIHAASVTVSREHKRAKTDRLDAEMLLRAFLGWLRGEAKHCAMVAIPTLAEEDARRPCRERQTLVAERTRLVNRLKAILAWLGIKGFNPKLRGAAERLSHLRTPMGEAIPAATLAEIERAFGRLALIGEQIAAIERTRLERLKQQQQDVSHDHGRILMTLLRVIGIGVETADLLTGEILSRHLRDRRALARYAGLTGSPDESGAKRREKGLARTGNARVRRAMLELAWRCLVHQKGSDLVAWFNARTAGGARKTRMIVAMARKLLIALWRLVETGEITHGLKLRPAA